MAVGNEVPGLTIVEIGPGIVVGSDQASVVLQGLHGVLVAVLGFRALGARCL